MNDEVLREPPPVVRRARHAFRKLSAGTRPLVYSGNRIELLRNGEQYFPRLLAAIDSATQSIYIETYTFALDNIGEKVCGALTEAAGVPASSISQQLAVLRSRGIVVSARRGTSVIAKSQRHR